jgi:hypothetical protein
MIHGERSSEAESTPGGFGGQPLPRRVDVPAGPVVEAFIGARSLSLPVGLAPESGFRRYGVKGIPLYTLIDTRGVVRSQSDHVPALAEIRALLD